jgi:hypothetical protein
MRSTFAAGAATGAADAGSAKLAHHAASAMAQEHAGVPHRVTMAAIGSHLPTTGRRCALAGTPRRKRPNLVISKT